jgi:hypothetical protein
MFRQRHPLFAGFGRASAEAGEESTAFSRERTSRATGSIARKGDATVGDVS